MQRIEIEREADQFDRFVLRQQRRCRLDHHWPPNLIRMHPRDYELLMIDRRYIAQWSATEEFYRNMQIAIDTECTDGPVVECKAYWEHGRKAPRGYVPSQN